VQGTRAVPACEGIVSVQLLVPIQHRPFRGYDDPGLPNGIWIVQSSVLGDASGGNMILDVVFKDGSLPVPESSLMYNLEQVNVVTSTGGTSSCSVNPSNWDELSPGFTGGVSTVWGYLLSALDALNVTASRGLWSNVTPWFLGQVRKNTTNTIVRFQLLNGGATTDLSVKAEGYFWGPGAINAPGGPRRPTDSIYG